LINYKEKANIGFLSWIIDRKRTGVDNYLYNLIENMIKMGKSDELSLIHYKKTDDPVYSQTNDVLIPKIPFKLTNAIGLPYAIKKAKIDVLHVPAHWHSQISPFFFNNAKKVLTVHDLIPLLFPETYSKDTVLLWNSSLKLIKNRADIIIAVSQSTKNDCIKYLNVPEEKIKVILEAADPKYKPLNDKDEIKNELKANYGINYPFILFVGRIEARKNVPTIIKALYKLKKKGMSHKLVIIGGKGWKYKEVIETIANLELQKDVIFTDYVPDEDLVKFYNVADLLAYPSLYEGFGLPPLEAMACGTPVVTSNTSSLPEVVGSAGIMVNPNEPSDLVDAIYEVLTNDGLKDDLRKKGLDRAKLFSWRKAAHETWKVYEEIV
jgi:glycosyltransferase involved in cell wall biosynthesis